MDPDELFIQTWECKRCGKSGEVTFDDPYDDDLWNRIASAHHAASPNCWPRDEDWIVPVPDGIEI